uniref:Uncharacterized protein n=1 Tax=Fundidesulfovibrio putealis TaxID=270496 RepID=A0A7C4AGV6_9BACT
MAGDAVDVHGDGRVRLEGLGEQRGRIRDAVVEQDLSVPGGHDGRVARQPQVLFQAGKSPFPGDTRLDRVRDPPGQQKVVVGVAHDVGHFAGVAFQVPLRPLGREARNGAQNDDAQKAPHHQDAGDDGQSYPE